MTAPAFLAADWGTTNLRAWVVGEDGAVLAEERFPWGVGKLPRGEAGRRLEESIRPTLNAQELPAVLCGMIGSTLGMIEVPYIECPASMDDLAAAMGRAGETPSTLIAPGVRCRRADGDPDVMRGEETKILGWVSLDAERARGRRLLCLPGTHPKWAVIEDGRLTRFLTAMTGEVFAVLSCHSVLKTEEGPEDADAFLAGVERGRAEGALAAKLFSARSRVVGGDMAPGAVRDYLSGLLVGEETARLPVMLGCQGSPIDLVGDPELCRFYSVALREGGADVAVHDGDEAVLAGLRALYGKTR
ncbi:MAG: 2-dehydro-3-deoxygalactonokinase [Caulobacteraceae bacterium]